VDGKLTAILHI